MDLFAQLMAMGIITGTLYSLLAVSWGIIFKVTKTFHFAHGIVFTIGAYSCYGFTVLGLPVILSVVLAVLVSVLLGVAIEVYTYRPMRRMFASPISILISALGTLIVGEGLLAMGMGSEIKSVEGFHSKSILVGSVAFTGFQLVMVIICVLLCLLLLWFVYQTRWGRILQAVSSNPGMAEVVGIDSPGIYVLAFAIGSALAGVAGSLSLLEMGANPYMGTMAVLIAAISVIMGGVESLPGGAISGFILGVAINVSVLKIPSEWQYAIAFGILIVLIILRPEGILKQKTR
jgi:branched-chain amino acid transport system permease protein